MRLIDADALDISGYREDFPICECDTGWNAAVRMIKDYVDAAPTIDAAPVVRCKDCKHRRDYGDIARGYYCVKRPSNCGRLCKDNDFCSYGERGDGEGNG